MIVFVYTLFRCFLLGSPVFLSLSLISLGGMDQFMCIFCSWVYQQDNSEVDGSFLLHSPRVLDLPHVDIHSMHVPPLCLIDLLLDHKYVTKRCIINHTPPLVKEFDVRKAALQVNHTICVAF